MTRWDEKAACLGVPTEVFFPESRNDPAIDARQVCAGCDVLTQCAAAALAADDQAGVRAGFRLWVTGERRSLRRFVNGEPESSDTRIVKCIGCDSEFEESRKHPPLLCAECRGLLPADPVRAHLRALQKAGLTNQQIIHLSGVSWGTFSGVLYGVRGKLRPHVTKQIADKIMAVAVPAVAA
jgi:WhiB family redox-sensing transcriptional regulator